MTDEQKQKDTERANAYKAMFEMWAWKDFMKFLEGKKQTAIKEFTTMNEPSEFKCGQLQGIFVSLDSIENELGFIVSERR